MRTATAPEATTHSRSTCAFMCQSCQCADLLQRRGTVPISGAKATTFTCRQTYTCLRPLHSAANCCSCCQRWKASPAQRHSLRAMSCDGCCKRRARPNAGAIGAQMMPRPRQHHMCGRQTGVSAAQMYRCVYVQVFLHAHAQASCRTEAYASHTRFCAGGRQALFALLKQAWRSILVLFLACMHPVRSRLLNSVLHAGGRLAARPHYS